MKYLLFLFLLATFNSRSVAQTTNCDSLFENYYLGGLDCYLGVIAFQAPAAYQWLDCDNNYTPIPNDTLDYCTAPSSGYVAVEITSGTCVDTSYCQFHCIWGINEINQNASNQLVKEINLLGQDSNKHGSAFVIEVYGDGTRRKVVKVD